MRHIRSALGPVILIALVACQGTPAPSSSAGPPATSPSPVTEIASPPTSSGAATTPPDSAMAIDPDWITRPALTCGDPDRRFPPEALAGVGLAEFGLDAAADVLRAVLADAQPESALPDHGWHRVIDDPAGVTFVAMGDAATPWLTVSVGVLAGTLQATEYGQCHLGIAAPDGVSLATWWLDPAGPPVTPATTVVAILLRERECASGRPPEGRVLDPTIVTTSDAVEVAIGIRKPLTGQDCPGNPAHPMRLVLPEPIGARGLFDASAYPPRRVTTDDPG